MKYFVIILSLSICLTVSANDCASFDDDSAKQYWNDASEVFLGKVTSARLLGEEPDSNYIETTIKITETFKGNPKSEFIIETPSSYSDFDLTVGSNAIFFLYGSYKLNGCNSTLYINPGVMGLKELIEYTDRADLTYASVIKTILVLSGKMP